MKINALIIAIIVLSASPHLYAVEENMVFVISDVTPKTVEPGYQGDLNITIRNIGFAEAYRLNAEIGTDNSDTIHIIGETKKYIEFRDIPCTNDPILCNFLGAGDSVVLNFKMSIDDSASVGGYIMPLTLYWKFSGFEKTTSLNFGIEVIGAPKLILSGISTAPSIVYPDTEFSMPVTVENTGTDEAKSAELKLTLPEGITGEQTALLGTISKDATTTATFNLKAGKEISIGHHSVPASLTYKDTKGTTYTATFPLDIFIQDRGDAKLTIAGINTTPSKIYSNTEFTLDLSLENTGSQAAKSISLSLELPDEFTGEDSAFLGTISKGSSSSASFDLKALKSSEPGAYAVKVTSTYTDEQGRELKSQEEFTMYILDRGEVILEISGKSTSPTKLVPGSDFTLSLQLENIGEQDAKSVKVELEPNGDIIGEFSSFVGEIEKDDVSTGVFDLKVSEDAQPGPRRISANVIYIDERGVENSVEKSFDLFIAKSGRSLNTTGIVIAALAVLVLLYLWRRRKSALSED